jgi:PAS domain S-box-containing protein
LSRTELDLDQAFTSAADPAFVLDPIADRFLAANPAACALLGYTHEELLATPVSRIHPGELAQLQEFVGAVLSLGHGTTVALTCRTRPGAYLPVEMSLAAFDHDGRTLLLGLVHDRSEHRQRPVD